MSFAHEKLQFLKKPDKSLAGGIDRAIKKLVDKINSKEYNYTTSSCAGRILLMPEKRKKQEKVFCYVYHDPISFDKLIDDIKGLKNIKGAIYVNEIIYLKHEPCIMHVACKDLKHAKNLINKARHAGWKKSGIISIKPDKVMCELVSTEILAAPIANNGEMIVNDKYLKFLVKEANKKLEMTRTKIDNLMGAL